MAAVLIELAPKRVRGHSRENGTPRWRLAAALAALGAWSLLWFWLLSRHGGVSWHYFVEGGTLIENLGDKTGGLHLYATRPDLQFGPLSIVAAALLLMLGNTLALFTAQAITALAGLLIILTVRALAQDTLPDIPRAVIDRRVFLAAIPFVPVWMNLAVRFVHIDDMLALVLTVLAIWALHHRLPYVAAVLLALGVDAKPWAVPFVALLLLVEHRQRLRSLALWAITVLVAWVPFLVADPRTLNAGGFQIPVDPSSPLALFGLSGAGTPVWVRTVQVLGGTLLAVLAVRRGRWAGVVLLVVLARIVIDPGAHSYYAAGVVVGAAMWDVLGTSRRLPWWTLTSSLAFFAFRWLPQPDWAHGVITVVYFAAAVWWIALRPAAIEPSGQWIVRPPDVGRVIDLPGERVPSETPVPAPRWSSGEWSHSGAPQALPGAVPRSPRQRDTA